jgi:hypothetical protein
MHYFSGFQCIDLKKSLSYLLGSAATTFFFLTVILEHHRCQFGSELLQLLSKGDLGHQKGSVV